MVFAKVSVHGGHSGTYCSHAKDPLEDIVQRYIEQGFEWCCLTEHIPPINPSLMPPEEKSEGYDCDALHTRFDGYFHEARLLQKKYEHQIDIYVGFETEAFSGYEVLVQSLIDRHKPQMIVGSVHHLKDFMIDGPRDQYEKALDVFGNIESLYCAYFDKQLELINRFRPAVVGHFDLIRMHDPQYEERWSVPEIRDRALRNLKRIKELDLVLDLNVRSYTKKANEPYLSEPWLRVAIREGIKIALGDDSHGVMNVGQYLEEGVAFLRKLGGKTTWAKPSLWEYD